MLRLPFVVNIRHIITSHLPNYKLLVKKEVNKVKVYAYIRQYKNVSISEQLKILKDIRCDEVFIEEQLSVERIELQRLQTSAKSNDKVIVTNIKVLSLDASAAVDLMTHFISQNIGFVSLEENFNSKEYPSFTQIFLGLEEMDKCHKFKQTDVSNKKIEYVVSGRPPVDGEKIQTIRFLYRSKSLTMRQIATKCNVSLGTVHKYLNNSE